MIKLSPLVPLASSVWLITPLAVRALPVPDGSLGTRVNLFAPGAATVDGGTEIGPNLFHSFESFDIETGELVYFASPMATETIFSRVTGASASTIDGVVGTFGSDASLFLINPSGVAFGPNASLDVQGSFVATTADTVALGETGFFSTAGAADSLLAVDPSALLFSDAPAGIFNQARAVRPSAVVPGAIRSGLEVPPGEMLGLVGGEIVFDGGEAIASGGTVAIAALADAGRVGLSLDEARLTLPQNAGRGDISIANFSRIETIGDGGGDVVLSGNNLSIAENTLVVTGIGTGAGTVDSRAGDIVLTGTGTVEVANGSLLGNGVFGTGSGGDILISAERFSTVGGSQIAAVTFGQGSAGNIEINATDSAELDDSELFTIVELGAVGSGGDLRISAASIRLGNAAQLTTSTAGIGDAGNILLSGTDRIVFDDSTALSGVQPGAVGNGGNIDINAPILEVISGGQLASSTLGTGDAGSIIIVAPERVIFEGVSPSGPFQSAAFTSVGPGAVGSGGNIDITTGSLEMLDSSGLIAGTSGRGSAGDILLTASERIVFDGGAALSSVDIGAVGSGGDIRVAAPVLEIRSGSQLAANTQGSGDAGNVLVTAAERVTLTGADPSGQQRSGLVTSVGLTGQGSGGSIRITTELLEILDGGQLNAVTLGNGVAGSVVLNVGELMRLSDGQIFVQSFSDRAAGSILITAGQLRLEAGSTLSAETATVDGGNIVLTLDDLLVLRDGSRISATAGTAQAGGNGGNISISAPFIVAIPEENSDITANAFTGSGGRVVIVADGVFGIEPRPRLTPLSDITASSDLGVTGEISFTVPDNTFLENDLSELPDSLVNPETLLASSCVVRSQETGGTFVVTGNALATEPESEATVYGTGSVRGIDGQPLAEPSGIYQTADGRLVMSQVCQ